MFVGVEQVDVPVLGLGASGDRVHLQDEGNDLEGTESSAPAISQRIPEVGQEQVDYLGAMQRRICLEVKLLHLHH